MPDGNSRTDNTRLSNLPESATILIPDMNFTCSDRVIAAVTVVAPTTIMGLPRGNRKLQLQIWRQSVDKNGVFYKVEKNIVLTSDVCMRLKREPLAKKWQKFDALVFQCSLPMQPPVQRGDVLGIKVPSMVEDLPLYFTESGPINYVFLGQNSGRVNLSNYDREIAQQPLITLQVVSNPGLSIYKYYSLAGGRRVSYSTKLH